MNNLKETKDYYTDSFGRLTYKAAYHLERGECCFNNCLHCPYGTTVEKYGLKYKLIDKSVNNPQVEFSLKGYPCASYDLNLKVWTIYPQFESQNLEDDLNLSLRIFYEDKGEQ